MGSNISSYLNKFFIDNYMLTSPFYNNKSLKLLNLADFHFHKNVPREIYQILIQKIFELKPDFILMPGDIIENSNFLSDPSSMNYLISLFKELSFVSKIIIVLGNHELKYQKSLLDMLVWFKGLCNIPNIYFLENETLTIDNISFHGFSPSYDTYIKPKNLKIRDKYIKQFITSNFKINDDSYNILLTHSPILLFDPYVKKELEPLQKMDLTVSGHLHDGYLPKCLDKYFSDKQIGIYCTPYMSPFTDIYPRGIHEYGRGYILVGQGFRKYTHDNFFFNFLEKHTANDIETITLEHQKTLSYKKQV